MPMVIVLRVLAVIVITVGILLVAMAVVDPTKTGMDVIARALIWSVMAVVAWSQSMLHERI